MSPETCEYHVQLASDIAVIKQSLTEMKETVCDYVHDGVKPGGYRERLALLEKEVSALKKALWIRVFVAGILGGLIGEGSGTTIGKLINLLIGG